MHVMDPGPEWGAASSPVCVLDVRRSAAHRRAVDEDIPHGVDPADAGSTSLSTQYHRHTAAVPRKLPRRCRSPRCLLPEWTREQISQHGGDSPRN